MSILRWTAPISNNESLLKKLLLVLLLLNLGDMLSTIWGVEAGILIEANPLLRWCMDRGVLVFALVKTVLCVQFVIIALVLSKKVKYFVIVTSVIVLFYSAVVIRSFGLLI